MTIPTLPTIEHIKKHIVIEQVLSYFDIEINEYNKILCPAHEETQPSCQVNKDYVFCFGCDFTADAFSLTKHLLEKQYNRKFNVGEVLSWFADTELPEPSARKYNKGASYIGPVNPALVEYWVNQMTDERYDQLYNERLITKETAVQYGLGWRPEYSEWSIPFWRGVPGNSEIDIVQFRKTDGTEPKYLSLTAHARGSVMNAHLLEQPQDYFVILFGAYDGILAAQDGLLAGSTNGSFPFKKNDTKERERVQQLFAKQRNIFIVPDNTPSEYQAAYRLAEWLDAEVRFFDTELPAGCDYIDYRKLGHTAEDFKQDVLGITPITAVDAQYIDDILTFLKRGDPCKMASVHAIMRGTGTVAADVARTLALQPAPFSSREWAKAKRKLWKVKSSKELVTTLDMLAVEANRLTGAW